MDHSFWFLLTQNKDFKIIPRIIIVVVKVIIESMNFQKIIYLFSFLKNWQGDFPVWAGPLSDAVKHSEEGGQAFSWERDAS